MTNFENVSSLVDSATSYETIQILKYHYRNSVHEYLYHDINVERRFGHRSTAPPDSL